MPMVATIVLAVLIAAAARARDMDALGLALIEEHCAGCHAIGKTGASPLADAPPFREIGEAFDLDRAPDDSENFIASVHPQMPAFKFTPAELRAIRIYLRAVRN